jgi:hypothetical protein
MEVTRAAGIKAGHDRFEAVAAIRAGELMPAQAHPVHVVLTGIVSVPDFHHCPCNRAAGAAEDGSC